jgi:UDP-glucuronate decarboxylase
MKAAVVSGAAGFLGHHLCLNLLRDGFQVVGIDNFYSGQKSHAENLKRNYASQFHFLEADIRKPLEASNFPFEHRTFSHVFHLACPASPPRYQKDPFLTLETSVQGTDQMCRLAEKFSATLLFTSTSEVYGDPEVHPQPESYTGSVNTWGARACYDEGKRAAETLCYLYESQKKLPVRVARIFNTYGPGMDPHDGRVMTALILAALKGEPYPIFGDGSQTRSFCYVDDLVAGLRKLGDSKLSGPVNLGNPEEVSVVEMAKTVHRLAGKGAFRVQHFPLPQHDPKKRRPDITRAARELSWTPVVSIETGLKAMIKSLA